MTAGIPFPVPALGRRLLARLALAIGLVLLVGAGDAMAQTIGWNSFERVDASGSVISSPTYAPSGEDRIQLLEQYGVAPAGTIQVVLKTANHITWEKGIDLQRRTPETCGWFGCYYNYQTITGMRLSGAFHGPVVRTMSVTDASTGRLQFGKAKFLGVYTGMYELPTASRAISGARYTFTWVTD